MKVGIIGGSGLYNLKELDKVNNIQMDTPFGKPSSNFLTGELHNIPVVFIPRHGIGHVLLPTEIPFRANIWGLKKLGVTHLISVGAVGSLKEEIIPGHIVFPDQFIDLTRHREIGSVSTNSRSKHTFGGDIYLHGRSSFFFPCRVTALPIMGCRRNRNDKRSGS